MPLTPYQQLLAKVIEKDPQFDRWCPDPNKMKSLDDRPDVPGTKLFTYYTKDGKLHADRIGKDEIMFQITFPPDGART